MTQTLETFVLVKSITMLAINVAAAVATVALAAFVASREGLLGGPHPAPYLEPRLEPAPVPVRVDG